MKKTQAKSKRRSKPTASNAVGPASLTPPAPTRLNQLLTSVRDLEGELGNVLRQMQEKVRQLETLTEFSSLLNSTLDTAEVREKALEATCRLLACETASLFLIDAKTAELTWDTALGNVGQELKQSIRLPIDNSSIAGSVAMSGERLILNDVQSDPRHSKRASEKTRHVRTMVVVPLLNRGKTIGVLQAINKLPSVPARPTSYDWPMFNSEDLRLLETLAHQVAIAVENAQLYSRLKSSFYQTVEAIAEAIEKKDQYTGGHTKRVKYFSECIAKYLDMTPAEIDRVRLSAIMHDVGKIGIEDKILKKSAPLDPYEWPVMKTHPELGFQILKKVDGIEDVIAGMRLHHERWDGKGYPLGLKGEEIPLVAQIIAVADTYDAMISTRPYRKGMDPQVAYDEISANSGIQFAPRVVEAFKKAYKHEKMGQRGGDRSSLKKTGT